MLHDPADLAEFKPREDGPTYRLRVPRVIDRAKYLRAIQTTGARFWSNPEFVALCRGALERLLASEDQAEARAAQEAQAARLAAQQAEIERRAAELRARQEDAERSAEAAAATAADAECAADPIPGPAPVVEAQVATPPGPTAKREPRRPRDDELIATLALHYRVHELKVIEWLLDMDLDAASARAAANL